VGTPEVKTAEAAEAGAGRVLTLEGSPRAR